MIQQNRKGEAVAAASADLLAAQIVRLKGLFPEAFTEGKVDWDKLRATLGDVVDDGPERYTFTWAGKRDAIRLLQTPTCATLVPCREESVNFYETQHIFIEGDNLEVLKLLYKPYFGRVKTIYIDPPYNTGNDFIYPDNYTDPLATYLQLTGQQDAEGNLLTSNPETSGRYHSAWLSMMYPRLFLARQLLREDGVIFISIDETELSNLIQVMNEVFGEDNQEAVVAWRRRHNQPNDKTKMISKVAEFILVYAKNSEQLKVKGTFYGIPLTEKRKGQYSNPDNDPNGPWESKPWKAGSNQSGTRYVITSPTRRVFDEEWLGTEDTYMKLLDEGRIYFPRDGDGLPRKKYYLHERLAAGQCAHNFWKHERFGSNQEASSKLAALLGEKNVFDNPKPARLIKMMGLLSTSGDDIVLDFFAGSCTTAQSVLELNREDSGNRRFIMVQLPEPTPVGSTARNAGYSTIAEIGKERIRRVIAKMQESKEKEEEIREDLGMKVFKLAPSNYRMWTGLDEDTPDAYAQQLFLFTDPLADGWTVENVIYEVALKEGYCLNCHVEKLEHVEASVVYLVTDPDKGQSFFICLEDQLRAATLMGLELTRDDLLICRDEALDDTSAANLALQCRLKTI